MRVIRFGNRCCCPLGLSHQAPDALLSRLLQILLAASLWFPDPCISEFGFIKPREKRHSPEGRHLSFLKARERETTG